MLEETWNILRVFDGLFVRNGCLGIQYRIFGYILYIICFSLCGMTYIYTYRYQILTMLLISCTSEHLAGDGASSLLRN